MTNKQKQTHASLVKGVHLSQRYQNYFKYNREEYTQMLVNAFGKNSSVALTIRELILLVDYCNLKLASLPTFILSRPSQQQVFKIGVLWEEKARDKSRDALEKFIFRVAKTTLNGLTHEGAKKVLIALGKMK